MTTTLIDTSTLREASTIGESKWKAVEAVLLRHYDKPDLQAARALYGAIAAHRLKGQPVWPMLVGPPGSMKTELLKGMQRLGNTHFIDQVTAQTFISGQIVDDENEIPGLLGRVGTDAILVYPDFSTILAMRMESRGSILADMRRIYDGEIRKEFGTGNNLKARTWKGRITFAVAATPDVDRQYSIFQSLGERFVMIRWGRPDGIAAALAAMNQESSVAQDELKSAVWTLFDGLRRDLEPALSEDRQRSIAALADFVTRARTHVARSGYTKEMLYEPVAEAPTRLGQQLAQLAKGSALLESRFEADNSDHLLVQRVAFDCIPTGRRKLLDRLIRSESLTGSAPPATLKLWCDDLEALGLLENRQLSGLSVELLHAAGIIQAPNTVLQ